MVYTKTGDEGETDLMNGERVTKTDVRIEAYGTVDELNSCIGTVRPVEFDDIAEVLKDLQNHLHIIQSELSNPEAHETPNYPQIEKEHTDKLEDYIDSFHEEVGQASEFILPGGSEDGSHLHLARSICRRAERRIVALSREEDINENIQRYVNRLSDLLFVVARVVNDRRDIEEENPDY